MKHPIKYAGLAVTLTVALGLSACGGGATVENNGTPPETESVAPLTRDNDTQTTEPTEEDTEPPAPPADPAEPQPEDQGAQEIDEIPEQSIERSPAEEDLLTEVGEGGVDVAGVEDQVIGAAATICDTEDSETDNVIVPAVSGQLIEQGRTELSHEEVTELIESTARSAYC